MTRRLFATFALFSALFLLLRPFGATGAQTERTSLTIGSTYLIDALNPTVGYYGFNIRGLLYETLVEAADGNNVQPGLAESWQPSDDGLTWTFKIRKGATFSDGSPATAVEAAWTINWIIENQVPTMISYLSSVTGAEALDATTLQINLSEPVSNMISSKLLYVYILPPAVWKGLSADDITLLDDPFSVTIGAGPYHLSDYQPDEYLILEANPGYWRGQPPVDQMVFRQYANDDALVQALMAGEVDLVYSLPYSGIPSLQSYANVHVDIGTAFAFGDIAINSDANGTAPASLHDPVVRHAIDLAIDRQQIITIGYLGYAQPGAAFLSPSTGIFHNSDIPSTPYDLTEANRLLDEAGYLDSNGDGIREYSDGTPLEYRLMTDDSTAYYLRILQIVSDGLAQIGISAPPMTESVDSLIARQIDYDFDMIFWEWNPDADPHFLTSVLTCAETADGGWNDSGYCNPTYDALFAKQATALNNQDRQAALWEMQAMIAADRPWVMIAYLNTASAYRSDRFTFSPNLPTAGLKWALFIGFSAL